MADTPTPPGPNPDPKKPKRTRGPVNKAHLETVSKTEKNIVTARKADYASEFATRELDEVFFQALENQCTDARSRLGEVVDSDSDSLEDTEAETAEKKALLKALREIQTAAKQKFADDKPAELKDFYVGVKINQSRTILEQAAAAIQRKLTSTTLPGITPVKVTALDTLVSNYKGADTDQSGGKKKASTSRLTLDELMDLINKGRRKILFAVEAAWPSDVAANGPIRREFGLVADRPFSG